MINGFVAYGDSANPIKVHFKNTIAISAAQG